MTTCQQLNTVMSKHFCPPPIGMGDYGMPSVSVSVLSPKLQLDNIWADFYNFWKINHKTWTMRRHFLRCGLCNKPQRINFAFELNSAHHFAAFQPYRSSLCPPSKLFSLHSSLASACWCACVLFSLSFPEISPICTSPPSFPNNRFPKSSTHLYSQIMCI